MADDTSSGSKQRVAYDLMQRIVASEYRQQAAPDKRDYYFKLYRQCLAVTEGADPSHIE